MVARLTPALTNCMAWGKPQLMQRTGDVSGVAVALPTHPDRLIAKWAAGPILLGAKERSMGIAFQYQIRAQFLHQTRIV